MIDDSITMSWIVDPGSSGYDWDRIQTFLDWLEAWDKPCKPSNRYYQLKKMKLFWGAHKFHIGLCCEEDAREFQERWGGFCSPGSITEGQFQTANPNAWWEDEYWKPEKMRSFEPYKEQQ
jgi:hypothetical protein